MRYDWNFSVLAPYAYAFFRGTLLTIALSVLSFVIGTAAGTLIGSWKPSGVAERVFYLFNDTVRALPPLVLLFLVYFFPVRQLLGVEPLSAFWSSVVAFSIAQAAYSVDLTRAALDQVPRNSILAGLSIGLTRADLWRFVVLPDLVRQVLPAQIAFFIGIIRLSNLASIIGCQEVVFVTRQVSSQAFRSFEPWILVAAIYVALVLPVTWASRLIEKSKWLKRRS
jgi:His/Glu/Gln/Arg/opine family amino acid ABC transporter permease subunit